MKKRIPVLLVGPLVAVVSMALLPLPVSSQALSTELESMGRSSRQPPPFVATQASDKGGAGAASAPAPFGSNLFTGGFGGERDDGLNPDYIIVPGDRITLRIWGATTFDDQATVDGQGNIFVPDIGPIPVAGTLNAGLTAVIERAVRTVFTQNVFVYTNLEGTSPVVVYVTGYVGRPGSYAGTATDSVLYFLSRAGGVDQARGSYRDVRILRDAKTIAKVDLYEFIMFGRLAGVQFRDGDTVLVGRRGASVSVAGKVRSQFLFEIPESGIEGLELIELVRPDAEASHVTIRGSRVDGAYSDYLTLSEFTSRVVQDGDRVTFEADRRHDTILVEIKGNHLGPSRYAVPTKTTLMRLLDEVEVDPALSDTKSISLRRSSVARQQKQALEDSLRRLENIVLTATSQTDVESKIRVEEAKLIADFVNRARRVQPQGLVVVSRDGDVSDLRLLAGDVVIIPERSNVVLVNGEVMVPQAIVHVPGDSLASYVKRVGGLTERADDDEYLVKRRNGEVVRIESGMDANSTEIRSGDEIVVLPKVPVKNLQVVATISQIIFQMALTAATVFGL